MDEDEIETTFKELMNCNTDERSWIDPEVEYEDRTTAPMIEVATIRFIEGE